MTENDDGTYGGHRAPRAERGAKDVPTPHNPKSPWVRWTPEEVSHIKRFYPFISGAELAQLFDGRHTERALRDKAWQLGIRKCHDRLRQMGAENVNLRWSRARRGPTQDPPQPSI